MEWFYLGGSFSLRILEHEEYGRDVVDCSDPAEVDHWCIESHGSVNGAWVPPPECPTVPVESGSWGSIKALYR